MVKNNNRNNITEADSNLTDEDTSLTNENTSLTNKITLDQSKNQNTVEGDLQTTLTDDAEYSLLALEEATLDNYDRSSLNEENSNNRASSDSSKSTENIINFSNESTNIFEDLFNVKNDSFFGSTPNFFKSIFGNPRSKTPASDSFKHLSFKDAGIRHSYSTGPNLASTKVSNAKTLSIFFDLKRYLNNKDYVKDPRNKDIHSFSVKIYSKTIEVAFKHSNHLLKGVVDRHPLLSVNSILKSSVLTDQGVLIAVFLI